MAAVGVGGGWGCRAIKFRAVNLAETSTLICKSVCSGERYRTIMVLLFFFIPLSYLLHYSILPLRSVAVKMASMFRK